MIFDEYIKQKLGIRNATAATEPISTLLDPETSAYIAAKYPMKSEFGDEWVRRREANQSAYPVMDDLVNRPTDTPQIDTLGGVVDAATNQPVSMPVEMPQTQTVSTAVPFPVVPQAPQTPALDAPTPEATTPVYPRLPSVETQDRINAIYNKDYSKAQYDEQGNLIKPAGADRDKKWSTLEKIGNAATGFLLGLSRGGLGGGIAEGVRGATDRNYNEKLDDQRELNRLYPRLSQQQQAEQQQRQAELQTAQIGAAKIRPALEQRRINQRDTELELRRSRQDVQALNAEQKNALSAIFKRGFYREGANPEEDRRLAELGIVLPDFDSRKREVKEQAGKFYQRDPDTNQWVETNMPTDESEVPIDFEIGGKRMKLRPRDIAGIEAANQRQQSQQTFTAEQNQLNREQQEKLLTIRQNFEREKAEWQRADDAVKQATTQADKEAAERRREESRKRILEYQNQLQKEFYDYKEGN